MKDRPDPEIIKRVQHAVQTLIDLTDDDALEWTIDHHYSTSHRTIYRCNTDTISVVREGDSIVVQCGHAAVPIILGLRRKLLSSIKRSLRRKTVPVEEACCLRFISDVSELANHNGDEK